MKKENGVTMVALIVTIIVLLILAGITIGFTFGSSGMLGRATQAHNTYEEASSNELKQLEEFDDNVKEETSSLLGMFKRGQIKVGDYIDYKIPESGSFTTSKSGDDNSNGFAAQTYDVRNNGEIVNWRVLGMVDSDGNITIDSIKGTNLALVSGSPVQKTIDNSSEKEYDKDPYLYMGKAEGYLNAARILDGISNIYKNNDFASSSRSITADDINTILGVNVDTDEGIVYEKTDGNRTNIDMLRSMNKTYSYGDNDYSANSFIKNKITAKQNGEVGETSTSYCYSTNNFYNRPVGNTTMGELLFNQTDFSGNNAKAYWLASTGVEANRTVGFGIGEVYFGSVNMGDGKFYSNGDWHVMGMGVRPVIILKPSITAEELSVIKRAENTWANKNSKAYIGDESNYDSEGDMASFF